MRPHRASHALAIAALALSACSRCGKKPLDEGRPYDTAAAHSSIGDPGVLPRGRDPLGAIDAGFGTNACRGSAIDLVSAIVNEACHGPFDPRPPPSLYEKSLRVTVTPSAQKIAGGGRIEIDVVLANVGTEDLPLVFSGGEERGVGIVVMDPADRSAIAPAGTCKGSTWAVETLPYWSRIVLAAGGEARAHFRWDAVAYRVGRPLPPPDMGGRGGCESVPAGPSPKGLYTVTVLISLWTQHPGGKPEWAERWPVVDPRLTVAVE